MKHNLTSSLMWFAADPMRVKLFILVTLVVMALLLPGAVFAGPVPGGPSGGGG